MQVVAMQAGFYAGTRRRIGSIFEMDESKFKQDADGKPILPKWVKAAANATEAKQAAAQAKKQEANKQAAGALAASGGQAAKVKVDTARDLAG